MWFELDGEGSGNENEQALRAAFSIDDIEPLQETARMHETIQRTRTCMAGRSDRV